jgi:GT2 family glycosyltransferase
MLNDLVSIIIVNYNGKLYLKKCLDSLTKINYSNYEIILVDNHSSDGSIEFVKSKYSSIKIIELDQNYGFAEPNNIAAKTATGKYFLFLNNDTIVTPNFVNELVKVMAHDSQISISQSMLLKPNGNVDSSGDFVDTLGRAYSSKDNPKDTRLILSAKGASMMIRNDIFWNLDGFDKNFFASFEDVDIGWRSWISGYKVVLVPNSIVYHTGGQTIKDINSLITFHGVKNSIILRLTNFEINYVIKSMTILFYVIVTKKLFGVSLIKDPEEISPLPSFGIMIKGLLWILKNSKYIFTKRKKVNAERIISTNDLLKKGLVTKYSF